MSTIELCTNFAIFQPPLPQFEDKIVLLPIPKEGEELPIIESIVHTTVCWDYYTKASFNRFLGEGYTYTSHVTFKTKIVKLNFNLEKMHDIK